MRHLARAVLTAGGLYLAGTTYGHAEVYWSSSATACVPDALTAQTDRPANPSPNVVGLNGTSVDEVVLNCAVTPNHGAQLPNRVSLTYRDSTGTNAAAVARAQLVQINRISGASATIAQVGSNQVATTTIRRLQSTKFSHQLDFDANYYVVRLFLDRTATSQTVLGLGTAVENNCSNRKIDIEETCDDGNLLNGDGCSATCITESGYACTGAPSVCSVVSSCGDGVITPAVEQCDDGNTASGDGCAASCTVESGFACLGQPSVCSPVSACGNGVVESGEQCDGSDLGGNSCLTYGFQAGTLACAANCTVDTTSCSFD